MVKVVKLSTASMVHAVLLRTIIVRHVKHTLAIFRANHIKTTAFHVLYHHITKYRLLTRRRLCRLSDSLLLTRIICLTLTRRLNTILHRRVLTKRLCLALA
ncbi:unknown [Prevotella sp. CAG:5226]|nr:unknown [Prevotella sp. CAG:5226]